VTDETETIWEELSRELPDGSSIQLRPATQSDFSFCHALYFETIKPLLKALDHWDEARAEDAFSGYFNCKEVRLIEFENRTIGWVQISENPSQINLDQIHILPAYRNRGLGTKLIRAFMKRAADRKKPLHLSFVKGNPAVLLYQRLGFERDGEDDTKLHMRWLDGKSISQI
jgi:ribosomal protein S18 acetylase RimI-like enzyme